MSGQSTVAARSAAARPLLRLLRQLARHPGGLTGHDGDGTRDGRRVAPSGSVAGPSASRVSRAAGDADAKALARRLGWIERPADGGGWRLSPSGRDALRRALAGQDLAETIAASDRSPQTVAAQARPLINDAESPLAWLHRRKGRGGAALIGDEEFQAGERLRADFWFAGMSPRVTADWSAIPSGSGSNAAGGSELRDSVAGAQQRVRRALAAVGPELAGILIDVCCHLKGIEAAEAKAGWPQRSGKVILRIALQALARHYGLAASPRSGGRGDRIRHWGAADYRPVIDPTGPDGE